MKNNKKTAVIIGATGNLGSAVCKVLKDDGYQIDPTWLNKDRPDATKLESYKNLPDKIDLAIYLPGLNVIKPTQELKEEEWDSVVNVNLKGAFLFAKSAFHAMKRSKNAAFVVISSIMVTHPYPQRAAYASSKAGLEGLTRELAVEWGQHGIYTHAIRLGHLSGLMKSTPANPKLLIKVKEKTPSHRLIDPSEVAQYILWLGNGGAKSVSGSIVDFDPAYTINRWPI
ncbi:MAG: hypothetical protein COV91_00800 [Candidatus Taylorbacteria bacterium CG11_big_fil_rev_8_21_14_0_20_46_11]|uniref:SDR family oxidoreductase n=1 Tax=Candidatus Taylorbacteria bacterium CG11_big_fil_rev_8_21_14_0_20_46_11 TaxID=1975025 RepID=A0A2H0KCN9_9BACT|nr:MAG: hypothetical protein COV91_00800 [Candidatus Taylorbacteria bacterium CG11_big_fil_rev_8_21_14_0_20_46_11]